jgi:hypothetical protein
MTDPADPDFSGCMFRRFRSFVTRVGACLLISLVVLAATVVARWFGHPVPALERTASVAALTTFVVAVVLDFSTAMIAFAGLTWLGLQMELATLVVNASTSAERERQTSNGVSTGKPH